MLGRCYNPNHRQYRDYGGRGINVSEYLQNVDNYIEYCLGLSNVDISLEIDRIDNNEGYIEGNLRWATKKQQCCNTRRVRYVTWKNEKMVWSHFVKQYTDLSVTRADVLLSQGYSLQDLTEYRPQNRGRRAQNLRLAQLRTQE